MECFCLRDDLPPTKIMLCFLFVVLNNIASLNTFWFSTDTKWRGKPPECTDVQDYVSFVFVLCPNSNQSPNRWLMTLGGILWGFSNIFHKTTQTQRVNFCPQLHPWKSSKVYKFAHVQQSVFYKILHIAFLVCCVWKYKLFTPDMHDQFLQGANKENIDTLYIYQ